VLFFLADALVRRGMNLVAEYKEVEVCPVPSGSCCLISCLTLSMICTWIPGGMLTSLGTVEGA